MVAYGTSIKYVSISEGRGSGKACKERVVAWMLLYKSVPSSCKGGEGWREGGEREEREKRVAQKRAVEDYMLGWTLGAKTQCNREERRGWGGWSLAMHQLSRTQMSGQVATPVFVSFFQSSRWNMKFDWRTNRLSSIQTGQTTDIRPCRSV